ncbi:hypothetical protein M9H77_06676 [Catharanthus roseus]|uniref:Uncharacterized protein n=1 Tax=Catharanthus roseus TaxID=4058 RepID=A0ACC0BSV4_CATRO|nr:hypothetical protein M9H77_06676 [Catharanthus roseus]
METTPVDSAPIDTQPPSTISYLSGITAYPAAAVEPVSKEKTSTKEEMSTPSKHILERRKLQRKLRQTLEKQEKLKYGHWVTFGA